MAGYNSFAKGYDILTQNIPYRKRGEYFHALFQKYRKETGILLDLACGTGSLSEVMAELGYDVIGVDSSEEMLMEAMEKKYHSGKDILYLQQDMRELDLFGTIDFCVCALDSLNHLTSTADLQKVFEQVSLFLAPGGLFVFDMNTLYKHERILSANTFIYDCDGVYCAWQNSECQNGMIEISLDLFYEREDGSYQRESDVFAERAYPPEEIQALLGHTNLELIGCYGEDAFEPPAENAERIVYLVKSTKQE